MTANVVHPRGRIRTKAAVFMAATALLVGAVSVFADGGALNVQVPDTTGYAVDTTEDGAIVEYIGDANETFGSSGTGVINSFLQTQDDPSEEGYNTDGVKEFDTGSSPTFNHSILVSEIPVVTCESLNGLKSTAGLCWELFADINDSNANDPAAKQIQLTDLEIWFTDDNEITGYDQGGTGFDAPADKVYDFDGTILINDVNQGSGRGDLRYLIPLNGIDSPIPADCDYGSSACTTYFVVYTEWGDPADGDYKSDSGFEEWTVKRYPFLDVTKTATTTFTRTFGWTIDKSVTPATWALFDGETGTSRYTVAVTKDAGSDSNWAVNGTITVTNPSDQDAVIASVTDAVSGAGAGAAAVSCPVSFPYTLPDGDDLVCTYSLSLPDGATRTNTATATLADGPVFTGTAAVTFGAPTTLVNDTIHVTDNNLALPGEPVAFSASGSVNVDKTFDCSSLTIADGASDSYTFNNTATITETGQTEGASVGVTCYRLDADKTADESRTRTYTWTVLKSVTPATWSLFDGESGTSRYTITVDKTGFVDSLWTVSGSITITNPHVTRDATLNSVSDVISAAGLTDVNATITSCAADNTAPYTVPMNGGTLVCQYTASLGSGVDRTNTATAVQQLYDFSHLLVATADGTESYSATAAVSFTGATTTEVNASITVSDDDVNFTGEPASFSDDGSVSYDKTFDCSSLTIADGASGSYTFNNTARITQTGQTSAASVDVTCYRLDADKTASTSYTREFNWDIAKTRTIVTGEDDGDGNPATLTLDEGQTYTVTYDITVGLDALTPSVDSAWAVTGTITLTNAHPTRDAVVNSISDQLTGGISATITGCAADNTAPYSVPHAVSGTPGTLVCSYTASPGDATDRTNTATAVHQLYDFDHLLAATADGTESYTATALADFGAPTTLVDECITIVDDNGTPAITTDDRTWGPVCYNGTLPTTFRYVRDVGPFATCGDFSLTNIVRYTVVDDANDTGETDTASYTIRINVPCPEGCTLTQGYWKTHNDSFWGGAPTDETWELIGPSAEEEIFFLSEMTYFDVMWTSPQGNVYFNLAHQYIAAELNMLDGADGSAITTAFDEATALFETWTDEQIAELKGKGGKELRAEFIRLAGILASYNEGDIGPGHCDEDATSSPTAGTTRLVADRRTSLMLG